MHPHQKAYVCTHVYEGARPVLLVSRADGDWSFLCGEGHADAAASYRVVGIGHVLQRDRSLAALLDLPPDWDAERPSQDGPWLRTPCGWEDT